MSDTVDPQLVFASELERRDRELATSLDEVERVQREVDELRSRATDGLAFLAAVPEAAAACAAEEHAARAALEAADHDVREAQALLDAAGSDDTRLAAEGAVQEARQTFDAAARRVEAATAAAALLGREKGERRAEARRLEARVRELRGKARGVARPGPGLDGVTDWASTARGALLLERAALAAERELVVREANELLGSVLGEPLVVTAVAGLRARLERALAQV